MNNQSLAGGLPKLTFLKRLTVELGVVQHARFGVPDLRHGYCLDDNARALVLIVRYLHTTKRHSEPLLRMAGRYLSYINVAQREDGLMHNLMSFNHHFLDDVGSDDSFGRAVWGLGECILFGPEEGLRDLAKELFDRALPHMAGLESIRAQAYCLLGLSSFLRRYRGHTEAKAAAESIVGRLTHLYAKNAEPTWTWFEQYLTYSNALLPYGLIEIGRVLKDKSAVKTGLESLSWVLTQTEIEHNEHMVAAPIGSNGWYIRGKERAMFDQQPVDVGLTVLACASAYRASKQKGWVLAAERWHSWFLGHNMLDKPVADVKDGSSCDGLHATRVNKNRGAESTIMFLLSQLEIYRLNKKDASRV